MNEPHWDHLIHTHLDGMLTEAELGELESLMIESAAARRQFWEIAEVHGLARDAARSLWGDFAAVHPSDKTIRAKMVRHWFQSRPLAAAAVFLILGSLAWLMWPGSSETGLMIASADAAVSVERSGEILRLNLGALLHANDVVVSEGTGIVLSYLGEETRLELAPGTRLEVLGHRRGKQLRLQTGSLSAEVSPQPENRPMRLFTTDAEAVVLGTRFTLNADSTHRELAVQKGAVRVNRATKADSIVVSAEERVKLDAESLELESLPPPLPPRWRDAQTLALDFETEVTWPMLRRGRVVADPAGAGHCLAGELTDLVRRRVDQMVLTASLRPQCVLTEASRLRFRYWAPEGIESIELSLYVFGVDRAFKVLVRPKEHGRWVEWSGMFDELKSAAGAPPSSSPQVRSFSIHTSPVSGPLAFLIDDVVLEKVSALPPPAR